MGDGRFSEGLLLRRLQHPVGNGEGGNNALTFNLDHSVGADHCGKPGQLGRRERTHLSRGEAQYLRLG